MRPYWAIIVDSFRESLNSKVLWCLLALITLFLLALAPIGTSFTASTKFYMQEIDEIVEFSKRLEQGSNEPEDSIRNVVWEGLDKETQKKVVEVAGGKAHPRERFQLRDELADAFNDLIERDELFNEEQRQPLSYNEEGLELLAFENRSEEQNQRLNRLSISALFPRFLPKGASEAMRITYLGMNASDAFPFDADDVAGAVKMALAVFMNAIAAPLGVFAAILVTASIIPNMFDAGSVNLLFSKPINRVLMFLAKFFGGCWFVLINASYLVFGLWLVIGLRLGIWHEKLLWVIPVLTFLFAVYYSVSALAGIVWRNTIMAVAAAVLFWGACFAVGFIHDIIEELLVQPQRIVNIVAAGESVLTIDESGSVSAWQDKPRQWQQVFVASRSGGPPAFARRDRYLGPVYDPSGDRILAIHKNFSNSQLVSGHAEENWKRVKIDTAPAGSIALLAEPAVAVAEGEEDADPKMGFIVVDRQGISRIVDKKGPGNKTLNFFGAKYTLGPKRGSFDLVGPKPYPHAQDAKSAVLNATDGSLYIYAPGNLHRLTPTADDGKYEVVTKREIYDDNTDAIVATGGKYILLAGETGDIQLLDAVSLETKKSFPREEDDVPRFAAASPDGRYFAILYHSRSAWCYDAQADKDISGNLPRQTNITALTFRADGKLLVASDPPQVQACDPSTGAPSQKWQGSYPLLDSIHYYGIRPLYNVFPKPGKLKETGDYLMTEKSTMARGPDNSLGGSRVQLKPWKPVWQSAIFMCVMLFFACIYVSRQEL